MADLEGVTSYVEMDPLAEQEWRQKTERMHILEQEFLQAHIIAMSDLQGRAKIIVMTVDGCVQCISGLAMQSKFFENLRIKAGVVEECQQVEHGLVSPIAYRVQEFLLLIGDDGQGMNFQMPTSHSSGAVALKTTD